MNLILTGQILGLSFACGLNLYLTVAALGILHRLGFIESLPPSLQGLGSIIVIASALVLFLVEAVIDRTRHADSLWDTVHTFIRPPAAALLATSVAWGRPAGVIALAVFGAFVVALVTHGTKAGLRLALNATLSEGRVWISTGEDLLAVSFATLAFLDPRTAVIGTLAVLLLLVLTGPAYWRAGLLGVRSLRAWLVSFFTTARWREDTRIPRRISRLLEPSPLGAAAPRATRAALDSRATGAFRNGWLVLTARGPVFIYRTIRGRQLMTLPQPRNLRGEHAPWTDLIRFEDDEGTPFTLYILKEGPSPELMLSDLQAL